MQIQTVPSPRQPSASGSVLSQIAESSSEQPKVEPAELFQTGEADELTQNAEDNYGDEFELDEPAVDDSAEPRPAAAASLKTYENPLRNAESADEAKEQAAQPFHSAPNAVQSHGAHVNPQLTVSDSGSVRLRCGLETQGQSLCNDDNGADSAADHAGTYGAGPHAPHVSTQLRMPEGETVKVQWSLDVSRPEPDEDAGEEENGDDDDQGGAKGRFSKMPSTPFPRRSIFSASGNMADDVDIFSTTQPEDDSASEAAASDLEPDFGGSLHRLSSDGKQESEVESGMELTPSYRQMQGRSLQQAADNEQPFANSWRPQPAAAQEADPVSVCSMERMTNSSMQQPSELEGQLGVKREAANRALTSETLQPTSIGQTPLRRVSSTSEGPLAGGSLQSGAEAPGVSVAAKQPSFDKATSEALPPKLPSQVSLPVQFSLDKLGSGSLSKQPSCLNVPSPGADSRRSSFSARIEREISQLFVPSQVSNAGVQSGSEQPSKVVSRTASLSESAKPPLIPGPNSRSLVPDAAASHEASGMPADQSLSGRVADLGRQSSQISRQPSGGKPSAAATAPSAIGSRVVSRQTSHAGPVAVPQQTEQLDRQSSLSNAAAAVTASPVASRVVSRQPSLAQPAALSQQSSQTSRQASKSSVAAAAAPSGMPPSRQPSLNRPGSASRQNSQLLQLQASSGNLTHSRSSSKVPSRQQSLASSGYPGQANVLDSLAPNQHVSQPSPASRSYSMSSQPQRSNSLEVLHRQMSTPRNARPVDQDAPAVAQKKMSQDREGKARL